MLNVDMQPWRAVRAMYIACIVLWFVLLTGRIVEAAHGEREIMSNPGMPPWTRIGQWDGWESGPITSKHYAHVTPMRGHFAWKYGQGPNGFVEIWPSDLYGFAPEADAHWADENNPALNAPPGAAHHDIASYPLAVIPEPPNYAHHEAAHGGHERRLNRKFLQANVVRPLVPAAVQWPAMMDPELVACAPAARGGQVAAFSMAGHGALISEEAASGKLPGVGLAFNVTGLPSSGLPRGATWSHSGLTIVSGTGSLHSCDHPTGNHHFKCQPLSGPPLPLPPSVDGAGPLPAVAVGAGDEMRFAAVAAEGGEVRLMQLGLDWELVGKVHVPFEDGEEPPTVVALSAAQDHLIVTVSDGATYRWELDAGRPASSPHREAPAAAAAYAAVGSPRTWRGACLLPTGKIVRLASRWQNSGGIGALAWHPELFF